VIDQIQVPKDRIIGSIVGGAIGDAYGGVHERGKVLISDDTQMTLATCEAILAAGEVSPASIAKCFAEWFRERRITGVGASTLKAMRDLEAGGHWALLGAKGERAAGNGAAMRVAPLAFLLDPLDPSQRVTIRDVCRITHHSDEAYCGALAVLIAIRLAALGTWSRSPGIFRQIADPIPDSHVKDRLTILANLPEDMPLGELAVRFGSSGFVAETVPLALTAAMRMTPAAMESVIAEIVEAGGDSDTIGSIAGQIAGVDLGFSRLPKELVANVPESKMIFEAAMRFGDSVTKQPQPHRQ
jgi:ADP-ribosyl-[dinitrogen reductase] hydrolase